MQFHTRRIAVSTLLFATCVALISCGVLPPITIGGYANVASTKDQERVERADVNLVSGTNSPNVFIGVGMSGRGSRAAVFGASALHYLDMAGFLDHVTAISSVSGGGLPAAKFALDGEHIRTEDEWNDFKRQMAHPYRRDWILKQVQPQNILKVALTKTTRTDLMADVFDDQIFHGATYHDLGQFGKRRPKLFINATDTVGESGARFTFSSGTFSLLLSDLSKFPISKAVAASAAFPGVFNPVTVRRHPTSSERNGQPPGFTVYHHLLDGGPSDNLGYEALKDASRTHFNRWTAISKETGDRREYSCMFILIDAYPTTLDTNRGFEEASRKGFIDYFLDRGFIDAFDSLLTRRRADLLSQLGFEIKLSSISIFNTSTSQQGVGEYAVGDPGLQSYVRPYPRIISVQVGSRNSERYICSIWHISLNQINSVPHSYDEVPPAVRARDVVATHPVLQYRQRLWHVVNRIATDFNLVGPDNCDRDLLLKAIDSSARILISEDTKTREQACKWFHNALPNETFTCETPAPAYTHPLELQTTSWPNIRISCKAQSQAQ